MFYNESVAYPGSRRGPSSWSVGNGDMLMFGGDRRDHELWAYNMTTNSWSIRVTDVGTTHPGPQIHAVLCGSLRTNTIVLMSGVDARAALIGRMWQKGRDESGWSEVKDLNPDVLNRWEPQSWCDSDAGLLYLFGGYVVDSNRQEHYAHGMWKYDIDDHRFEEIRVDHHPDFRYHGTTWIDAQSQSLWLMGGRHKNGLLNDLWRFDINENSWEEIRALEGRTGVYGEKGIGSVSTHPGVRFGAFRWLDGCGNLWLFGGNGYGAPLDPSIRYSDPGLLNDLWMYWRDRDVWVWMGGDKHEEGMGTYGDFMVASSDYVPGPRMDGASWSTGDVAFLFGGSGHNVEGSDSIMNDVWRLDMSGQCNSVATGDDFDIKPTVRTASSSDTTTPNSPTAILVTMETGRVMDVEGGQDAKPTRTEVSEQLVVMATDHVAAPERHVITVLDDTAADRSFSRKPAEQNLHIDIKSTASNAIPSTNTEVEPMSHSPSESIRPDDERASHPPIYTPTNTSSSFPGRQLSVNTLVDINDQPGSESMEQATGLVVNHLANEPTGAPQRASTATTDQSAVTSFDNEGAAHMLNAPPTQMMRIPIVKSTDGDLRAHTSFGDEGDTHIGKTPLTQMTRIPIVNSTDGDLRAHAISRATNRKDSVATQSSEIKLSATTMTTTQTSEWKTVAMHTDLDEKSDILDKKPLTDKQTDILGEKALTHKETDTLGEKASTDKETDIFYVHTENTLKSTEKLTNRIATTEAANGGKSMKPSRVAKMPNLPDESQYFVHHSKVGVPPEARRPNLPDESNLHLPHLTNQASSFGWFASRDAAPYITIGLVLFAIFLFIVGILVAKPCLKRKGKHKRFNYQKVASDDINEWQL